MFKEQAFNSLFRGSSEATRGDTRAGARAGARVSRTALKIYFKSFLECLRISVVAAGDFGPRSAASCLENSDSGGRKESRGVTERQSRQR